MILFITDVSDDYYTSTYKQVSDLQLYCDAEGFEVQFLHVRNRLRSKHAQKVRNADTVYAPLYKNKQHFLRLLSEIVMSLSMLLKIITYKMRGRSFDRVVYISPSIFNGIPAYIAKRVFDCDLHLILRDHFPFWLLNTRPRKFYAIMLKPLEYLARWNYNVASRIGCETKENIRHLQSVVSKKISNKCYVQENWIAKKKRLSTKHMNRKITRFIYSGNLAKAQYPEFLSHITEAISNCEHAELFLLGNYRNFKEILSSNIYSSNIHWQKPIFGQAYEELVASCDVGIVTLDPNLHTENIPGKFVDYTSTGLAVLGLLPIKNPITNVLKSRQLGLSVSEATRENAELLVTSFINMKDDQLNHVKSMSLEYASERYQINNLIRNILNE